MTCALLGGGLPRLLLSGFDITVGQGYQAHFCQGPHRSSAFPPWAVMTKNPNECPVNAFIFSITNPIQQIGEQHILKSQATKVCLLTY